MTKGPKVGDKEPLQKDKEPNMELKRPHKDHWKKIYSTWPPQNPQGVVGVHTTGKSSWMSWFSVNVNTDTQKFRSSFLWSPFRILSSSYPNVQKRRSSLPQPRRSCTRKEVVVLRRCEHVTKTSPFENSEYVLCPKNYSNQWILER